MQTTDDEDALLRQKIANLENRISRHQTNDEYSSQATWAPLPRRGGWPPRSRGRYHSARFSPYPNRTLVVNNSGPAATAENGTAAAASNSPAKPSGWVTKQDRHLQLINNSVLEAKTQQRASAMEETRKQKAIQREQLEKQKLTKFLVRVAEVGGSDTSTANPIAHELSIKGIKFFVTAGGSKLVKAPSEPFHLEISNTADAGIDQQHLDIHIPKKTDIGGVTFLRSKHGNYYRFGLVKTKRDMAGPVKKLAEPCPKFSSTGSCSRGPRCKYQHDPHKVAICRDFLLTGKCQAGGECDLSHEPSPERVPACVHFLRGNCTKPDCRYAHVRVNPSAPVCRQFAVYGYCPKGVTCTEKHVHECPDYANKGTCRNKKCGLPHVDRAGQLRNRAATEGTETVVGDLSDLDSDEEYDSDDVDSDEFEEEELFNIDTKGDRELAAQNDFVKF